MSRSNCQIRIPGPEITSHSTVLIGLLIEDAQEALSKNYKHSRTRSIRKMDRISVNEDVMN